MEQDTANPRAPSGGKPPPPLLAHALAYAGRGWSIIPVHFPKGKKAGAVRWKPYQNGPPGEKLLRKWFTTPKYPALGVVLGPGSGNLACRDFDEADAYHAWAAAHPDLAAALPTVQTARGFHVYFRAAVGKTLDLGDGELRGAKSLCVLPPSNHPKGGAYRWTVQPPVGDVPELNPWAAGLAEPRAVQKQTEAGRSTRSRQSKQISGGGGVVRDLEKWRKEIDAAILATLPPRPGTRNRKVFDFARALKAIPALADLPAHALRGVVRQWHAQAQATCTTRESEETWLDFATAWGKVRVPLSLDFLRDLLEKARANPVAGTDYDNPAVRLLLAVCRELQEVHGDEPFFLAVRTGAALLDTAPGNVGQWLKLLEIDGWIETVTKGGTVQNPRRATRFRFLDGGGPGGMTRKTETRP